GTTLRVITLTAVSVHYVPIMVWKGLSQTEAAFLLAAQAFLGFPTTLIFGWLGDRYDKPKLMAVSILLAVAGFVFFIFGGSGSQIWIVLALFTGVAANVLVERSHGGAFLVRAYYSPIP